jgi:hypothetical protein
VEELATFRFTHDMGSPEEVFKAFFLDMRKVLTRDFAQAVGQLLIKWGFMEVPTKKNHAEIVRTLSRYMGSVSQAVCKAIVAERQKIEREKHGEPPTDHAA